MFVKDDTVQTAILLKNPQDIDTYENIPPYVDNHNLAYEQMVSEYLQDDTIISDCDNKSQEPISYEKILDEYLKDDTAICDYESIRHESPSFAIVKGIQSDYAVKLAKSVKTLKKIIKQCYETNRALCDYYNTIYLLEFICDPAHYDEDIERSDEYQDLIEDVFNLHLELGVVSEKMTYAIELANSIVSHKKLFNMKWCMEELNIL